MADRVIPPVPAMLKAYPRAAERWNELWAAALEPTRVKPGMHGDTVAQYCMYYSDMRDAAEHMARGKLVAEKKTVGTGENAKTTLEKVSVSPYQAIFDHAVREMNRLGKQIGLDPLNPLEETKKFADYAWMLMVADDDEGAVDDGTSAGDGNAGDAGSAEATGGAGTGAGDGEAVAAPAQVLDHGQA